MHAGIEPVDAAGEKGDGLPGAREGRAMRHAVDPVCGDRDYCETAVDEPRRCLHRDVLTVTSRSPCPDEGNRVPRRFERLPRTQRAIGACGPRSSTPRGHDGSSDVRRMTEYRAAWVSASTATSETSRGCQRARAVSTSTASSSVPAQLQ